MRELFLSASSHIMRNLRVFANLMLQMAFWMILECTYTSFYSRLIVTEKFQNHILCGNKVILLLIAN